MAFQRLRRLTVCAVVALIPLPSHATVCISGGGGVFGTVSDALAVAAPDVVLFLTPGVYVEPAPWNITRNVEIVASSDCQTEDAAANVTIHSANPAATRIASIHGPNTHVRLVGLRLQKNNESFPFRGSLLRVFDQAKVTLESSSLENGHALDGGGAVTVQSGATLKAVNTSFLGNTTPLGGGAIDVRSAELILQGGTVGTALRPNTSNWGRGGGILAWNSTVEITHGARIDSNVSQQYSGGGIAAEGELSSISLVGAVVVSNQTAARGGGVFVEGGTLDVLDGDIIANSGLDGGGIWAGKSATVDIRGASMVRLNNASGDGGGICAHDGADLDLLGQSTVTGNRARATGGGIHVYDADAKAMGTVTIGGQVPMVGAWGLFDNTARNGGGVAVESSGVDLGEFSLTADATIIGNEAETGGGIYVSAGRVTVRGTVTMNAARSIAGTARGGGVYISQGSAALMGAVTENTATSTEASAFGGGIFASDTSVDVGSVVSDNRASTAAVAGQAAGGGIYARDTQLVASFLTVSTNDARDSGGGLHALDSTVTLEECKVQENHSDTGGGIFQDGGTFRMLTTTEPCALLVGDTYCSEIRGNVAEVDGSAIYVRSSDGLAFTSIHRTAVLDNNTVGAGAVATAEASTDLDLRHSYYAGNTSGSDVTLRVLPGGSFRIYESTFVDNETFSMHLQSAVGELRNNLVWDVDPLVTATLVMDFPPAVPLVADCNDAEGVIGTGSWTPGQNVSIDPAFATLRPHTIDASSPVVDRCLTSPSGLPLTDIRGDPRGTVVVPARAATPYDPGAFEAQ